MTGLIQPDDTWQSIFAHFDERSAFSPKALRHERTYPSAWELLFEDYTPSKLWPLTHVHDQDAGDDVVDGHFSRNGFTNVATTTLLRGHRGSGYYISDANGSDAAGQLTVDPHTGLLGLTDGKGDTFYVIQRRRLVDASGQKSGECFSLQSSTNEKLYLALNTNSPKFTVQGMTTGEMGPISNSYWRYIMFSEIGHSPPGSGYVALQYWGNHFGPPHENPYYFVIIPKSSIPFKIAPKDIASKHGRLGVKESS